MKNEIRDLEVTDAEEIRRDAARYRWLRDQPEQTWHRIGFNPWKDAPAAAGLRDATIDAEMKG